MFKRNLVPYLIRACKQQHLIKLIVLLMFIVGSQNVHPQQQIAQDAYAIFEQSCFICHGPAGSFKESLLIDHNTLIQNGTVIPGNPNTSELYNRLVATDTTKRMPLNQPQLSTQAINTIRDWILAGAPDWTATSSTDGQFISPGEILNTIETHLMSLSSFDRAFARYFTMTHLYNAGETAGVLEGYRNGLSKLVNSLSWGIEVINPQPIDPQQTIFYIDLRHYEWDVNDGWTQIEGVYPYHIAFDAPTETALREQLGRLQTEMSCDVPSIYIDWFLATASLPPLYHDLLSLPLTDRELETRLEVDVVRNLLNAPGVRVRRAGFNDSGVSNNNRVVERHTSRYGAYWKSYDFAGSVGTQNIFTHPLAFTHDGGEVVFNLPNGLQGYYLANASGFRLDEAPINIVSNPAASDPTVRNGLSCMGCHTEGMKIFEDEVRPVIESNTNPAYDKAQALRLYVEQSKMDTLLGEDMERYRVALTKTGGAVDDIEPISRFHEVFQGPVDVAYAAAVVGLETEVFLNKIKENVGLQNLGLLVLESGNMKRDTWTSSFGDIVFALDFPEQFTPPTVITPPERSPGTVVHIPDPNLRAAIAEALGKNPNAPITVEEMERLGKLDARNRGIRDLTGLQFATNLIRLNLRDNQISDLSPLAGLINLRELRLDHNFTGISDLSPLAGLINLEILDFSFDTVSDLSLLPLAGMTRLKYLHFTDCNVSDLSPLAGLVNLESLGFNRNNVSDLSPLAGLVNLKFIGTWGHAISDLSALAGLTKLEEINFCGGNISDISPLAGLTGLKELYIAGEKVSDISPLAGLDGLTRLSLSGNNISDISPLADLTNLKWLNVENNEISDFSPLDGLRESIKLIWYANPGFPEGGPKIEGPWLWLTLYGERLYSHLDLIQKATKGKLTEIEVATNGATEGKSIGDAIWTSHRLSLTRWNIRDMLQLSTRISTPGVIYGAVSLYSPQEQDTTMYVGGDEGLKVWLNGTLVYERYNDLGSGGDYTDFFPVTLQEGRNVLLVALPLADIYVGFEPGTEYTVLNAGVSYALSPTPIHTGDTFTLDILAENVFDMAGWQFDIAFDRNALEAIDVSEGDFLKQNGASTLFQGGSINNGAGKITGGSAVRLAPSGVSGSGTLVQVSFKAKRGGETKLTLQNFQFATITGDSLPAGPHEITVSIEGQLAAGDVNRDGQVTVADMILVAAQLGKRVPAGTAEDVNGDGIVNMLDLLFVAQAIDSPAAPVAVGRNIDAAMVEAWIAQGRLEDDGSLAFRQGIENLQVLLRSLIPEETALLSNYPNPFNPETWIPYQLAQSAEVTLTIYDMNGEMVRRLAVGHQVAGMYRSRSRAVYWDGRNQLGESVASGLYFYTLTAGDFTGTRRMLILK